MEDVLKKNYSLYDLSTQSGISRKKSMIPKASNQTISFYDTSVNLNNYDLKNNDIDE